MDILQLKCTFRYVPPSPQGRNSQVYTPQCRKEDCHSCHTSQYMVSHTPCTHSHQDSLLCEYIHVHVHVFQELTLLHNIITTVYFTALTCSNGTLISSDTCVVEFHCAFRAETARSTHSSTDGRVLVVVTCHSTW